MPLNLPTIGHILVLLQEIALGYNSPAYRTRAANLMLGCIPECYGTRNLVHNWTFGVYSTPYVISYIERLIDDLHRSP